MLPRPLELESSEPGRKSVHDHLHDPWTIMLRLPRACRDLAIMLTVMKNVRCVSAVITRYVRTESCVAGLAYFRYMT
jgi:hypothetical protein